MPKPVYPWRNRASFLAVAALAWGASRRRTLRALADLFRGLRVRAWNSLSLIAVLNDAYYKRWIEIAEPHWIKIISSAATPATPSRATIAIILDCADAPRARRTARSLYDAFGPDLAIWAEGGEVEGCNALPAGASIKQTLALVTGTGQTSAWILMITAGDTVAPALGSVIAGFDEVLSASDVVYWDSDVVIEGERATPWIKGNWDPLLFSARDSLSGSCVVSLGAIEAFAGEKIMSCGGVGSLFENIAASGRSPPCHVPLILSHQSLGRSAGNEALIKTMGQTTSQHPASAGNDTRGLFCSAAPQDPAEWPSVSIIIPTRDKAHLLANCMASLGKLRYGGDVEVIIVDNGSTERDALSFLAELDTSGRASVLRDDGPFNFAALNNRAAAAAKGSILCLLNNDVEALDEHWLSAMVRHATLPENGAVGALLVYPDNTVQHAGVAVGIGGAAGHIARGARLDDPLHYAWHAVTRRVTAVTAACLLVRREVFVAVGGMDEQSFPVAFNDIDFCLKVRQLGLNNVFVSEARLVHHESKSRGSDHSPAHAARFARELAAFRRRWNSADYLDPHYSPLFSRSAEPCLLAF